MENVRIRKDVWKLAKWDPILLWYARAVTKMQSRSIDHPTSWRYQAAIHDYVRRIDPYAQPSDPLPSDPVQKKFWGQCQHGSWFFLPWHRMYLLYFEQIVAQTIVELKGPSDWALPYWNYSDTANANANKLPEAFRDLNTPDGVPNPLRVPARNAACNSGGIVGDPSETDVKGCLTEDFFVGVNAGPNQGFGGPKTGFNHPGGAVGKLEDTPHGTMHVAVGGWMSSFATAGLDPIFWLHHANIDRLWSVWMLRQANHKSPKDPGWETALSFTFHDTDKREISLTSNQVVDTTSPPLFYQYEDVSDPVGATPTPPLEGIAMPSTPEPIPEMVGATEGGPITLSEGQTHATLAITQPVGPAKSTLESASPGHKIYLNIENITTAGSPENYAVYLNLPPDAEPSTYGDLCAGVFSTFGVAEASQVNERHTGSGVDRAVDVTAVVRTLQARNAWDPERVQITIVSKGRRQTKETGLESAEERIRVGRIRLYYA